MASTRIGKVPQMRVLEALLPEPSGEKPRYTRKQLASKAGFNPTTGTINRVLNGIPEGSSSGNPHPGLLSLRCVKRVDLDIDGLTETYYEITKLGITAYEDFVQDQKIPELRSKSWSKNHRYQNA